MQEDVVIITIGGLLHDIGKVAHRAENRKISHTKHGEEFLSKIPAFKDTHIPMMAAYHHSKDMSSGIAKDSPLYIVYIADNISAGLDRREEGAENSGKSDQKFEAMRPLASVFNILNGNNGKSCHKLKMLGDGINWPDQNLESYKYFPDNYGAVLKELRELRNFEISADSVNSLLKLLEVTLSFVPSSTNTDELSDISLFDHAKTTAALAACIRLYADAKGIADYKKEFFTDASAFYKKKAFMLCSFDLSGIQDFIYTVSGSGALKNLRARSFYLEMLAEHIADELLEAAGLSRANLIYTGGGHAYLLLPNTAVARKALADKEKFINDWLLQEFKTGLYCAFAAVECSGNDLMNKPEENKPYPELYKKLGAQLSDCKLHRYSAADIMKLNAAGQEQSERECSECRRTDNLRPNPKEADKGELCPLCAAIYGISQKLTEEDIFFAVSDSRADGALPLPGAWLSVVREKQLRELLAKGQIKRFYTKNKLLVGDLMAANLWMGDYRSEDNDFNELAKPAKGETGIERIIALRADVDNLGHAFVNGLKLKGKKGSKDECKYQTLSRTSTLSRQLSLFFKYHLNAILKEKERRAVIIYSGGDDLFIVGHWKDCLYMALDIRKAFKEFTCGTLTLSAGLGIYQPGYPIKRIAEEVGRLEEAAKDAGKNSLTLFSEDFTFKWDRFEQQVLEEKYEPVKAFFDGSDERGMAFLYRILSLLRGMREGGAKGGNINIARLAYMLARLEPDGEEKKKQYRLLADSIYEWAMGDATRKELECALTLYVYETRESDKGEEQP